MNTRSKFCSERGILFAADLPDVSSLHLCLQSVVPFVAAIKLGNSLLYSGGLDLVRRVKQRYSLPIVVDLKLTDVSHVASSVVRQFSESGADAIVVAGVCGMYVLQDLVQEAGHKTEIWIFTEFTNDSGLIDESLADRSVYLALQAGVVGFQAPGTRPHRVEAVRREVGFQYAIAACGIGAQGGACGSAITAGANLEIIGRGIYSKPDQAAAAERARAEIKRAASLSQVDS